MNRELDRPCFQPTALWLTLSIFGSLLLAAPIAAQPIAAGRRADEPSRRDAGEIEFPAIVSDEDLERLLVEADRRIDAGDWDLAGTLLQRVLDEGRTSFVRARSDAAVGAGVRVGASTDMAWLSASQAAEQRLARFSPEGLRRYGLQVDAAARSLLNGPLESASPATLSEVARRYAFTPLGQQAAWRLARRALERFDFVAASIHCERLKGRREWPRETKGELARVAAVAAAYLADERLVADWLDELASDATTTADFAQSIRDTLNDETGRIEAATLDDLRRVPTDADALATAWLEQVAKPAPHVRWEWRGPLIASAGDASEDRNAMLLSEPDRIAAVLQLAGEAAWTEGYDELTPRRDAAARGERWRRADAALADETLAPAVNRDLEFVSMRRDASLFVAAFRRADRAPLWETRVGRAPRDGLETSPVVLAADEGQVYASLGIGSYLALDARTGAVRWGVESPRTGEGASQNRMTLAGRWVLSESTGDGWIWALDRRDGRLAWGIPTKLPNGERVERVTGVRGAHVFLAGRDVVRAHEWATGRLRWSTRVNRPLSAPLLLEKHVLLVQTTDDVRAASPERLGIDRPNVAAWRSAELALLDLESGAFVARSPLVTSLVPPWSMEITGKGELQLASVESVESLTLQQREEGKRAETQRGNGNAAQLVARLPPLVRHDLANDAAEELKTTQAKATSEASGSNWRIFASDASRGAVMELSTDGLLIWESHFARLPGPVCGVDGRRRWAFDHATSRLVEWDAEGRPRRAWSGLPGRPASLSAALDGSVWMTFPVAGIVTRVDGEGKWRDAFQLAGRPVDAVPGAEGVWTALADSRQAVELDGRGVVRRQANFSDRPRWLQLLSDGVKLATFPERFQVVSWKDDQGKLDDEVVRSGVRGFRGAWKLPDGGWIVLESNSLACVDSSGRVRWKREGMQAGGATVVRHE